MLSMCPYCRGSPLVSFASSEVSVIERSGGVVLKEMLDFVMQ